MSEKFEKADMQVKYCKYCGHLVSGNSHYVMPGVAGKPTEYCCMQCHEDKELYERLKKFER